MSADQLVYDMASAPSETPSVFVKKDFFSVLDDQNGQYAGNQSVLQLSSLGSENFTIRKEYFNMEVDYNKHSIFRVFVTRKREIFIRKMSVRP